MGYDIQIGLFRTFHQIIVAKFFSIYHIKTKLNVQSSSTLFMYLGSLVIVISSKSSLHLNPLLWEEGGGGAVRPPVVLSPLLKNQRGLKRNFFYILIRLIQIMVIM